MKINAASSCWSGLPIQEAVRKIVSGETFEPLLGTISPEHIQICPQHINYFDDSIQAELKEKYPEVQFRLHADVRLKNKRGYSIDLSDYSADTKWYFEKIANYSKNFGSKVYSVHAGRRSVELDKFKDQYQNVQNIFGDIKVAVEGLYPTSQKKYIIDSWEEYAWLAENDISYALDLSHLKLIEKRFGSQHQLIKDLINNELCEEIHISFNNGVLDSHDIADEEFSDVFQEYKEYISFKQEKSVLFTEGNQVLNQIKKNRNKQI